MQQVIVTGTIPGQLMWTPFGYHETPSIPVTVTLNVDEAGKPLSVANVQTGIMAGPIQ